MRESARQAVAVEGQMSRLASTVAIQALLWRRYEKDFLLSVDNPRQRDEYDASWHTASDDLRKAIDAYAAAATAPGERQQVETWRNLQSLYITGFEKIEQAVLSGAIKTPQRAYIGLEPYRGLITNLTDQAVRAAQEKAERSQRAGAELEATSAKSIQLVVLISLIALCVAIAWCVVFPASIMRPVLAIAAATARLAAGDLKTRVSLSRADELGVLAQRFDRMAAVIEQRTSDLETQNAAASAARSEAEAERTKAVERLALIEQQRAVIQEMSVPILPLTAGTLVLPLVGALDTARIELIQERALRALQDHRVRYLILDITGVPLVDTQVARGLLQLVQAARLLGAEVVLVGIRPEVAQAVVGLGIDLGSIVTRSTLQSGLTFALQ
jgi:rsbT co-antagonist protein RsbR